MALAQILLPLLLACVAAAAPSNGRRPWLLPLAGAGHLSLVVATLASGAGAGRGDWLGLDPHGRLVLLLVSALFFLCSFYSVGYLRHRKERDNRVFTSCLLAFLGMTTLVAWARHLGLLWVALEATTLATAPLIYFNRTRHSIEATWKFLLLSSVGIALALLGSFFLAYSSMSAGLHASLHLDDLVRVAPRLSPPWLHASFVLLLVGYGTKMGLAPMHTWKPDAYGEAPGVVGALLAGGMTSCAFLAILRVFQICHAAADAHFAQRMLVGMGLLSMASASIFMARQRDFKRMLAYSSVEHMGILLLGVGLGGAGTFGAFLHLLNNGLTKGALFLAAGNLHRAYGSKSTTQVRGALLRLPLSGAVFVGGFLCVAGSPPFGTFFSEFAILNAAFDARRYGVAALFLGFLMAIFLGMAMTVMAVAQGEPSDDVRATTYRDGALTGFPPVACLAAVLLLGLWLPSPLESLLREAARYLEQAP